MTKRRSRRGHRRRDHRPRMGRRQGAEQAAAQMVAVDLLRHDRLGHRLLDRLSRPGRRSPATPRVSSAIASARCVAEEVDAAKAAQAQFRDKLAAMTADQSKSIPSCCALPSPAAMRRSRQLRAMPRPRRARLRRLSQPQRRRLAVGRRHRRHPQDHRYGIRSDQKETRASQMPRFGIDKLLEDKQINDVAEYVLSLSGKADDKPRSARGQTIFAEQCACLPRRRRQGQAGAGRAKPGRRDLALRRQPDGDRREHPHRARRRDAGLGRAARSRDGQGACRLRAQPRRREVGLDATDGRLDARRLGQAKRRPQTAGRQRGACWVIRSPLDPNLRELRMQRRCRDVLLRVWPHCVVAGPSEQAALAQDQGGHLPRAGRLRGVLRRLRLLHGRASVMIEKFAGVPTWLGANFSI